MLPKILSLLFPPTDFEKTLAQCSHLSPNPSSRVLESGNILHSCAHYDEKHVHAAIKILKKHGSKHASQLLAQLLNDVLLEEVVDMQLWNSGKVVLIPMPLSERKKRLRGFNQMEKVCERLPSALRSIVADDVLVRVKDSPEQKSLPRKERLKNVTEAFTVNNPELLEHAQVVVVDDVVATGATLEEALRSIRHAGVQKVTAVALARA